MASYLRNLSVIKQSLLAVVGNTSYFVKIVCLLVLLGYALSFSDKSIDVLSVTPGYILPPRFWLWTAFTHCFLEVRFWQVCVDLVTLGLCGKLIEPLWGSFEMILFFLLVNVCVAFISGFFYLIIYMCTFNPDVLFDVHIQGMAGYIAGLSVAVKQIMPDHVLVHTQTPLGKITNRHVPLLLFIVAILLYICHLLEGLYATMIGCGIAVSWVYLRFYQVHSNGTRGDLADSFKFSSFFPTVLQPPVQVVSDKIFSCLVTLRICRKAVRRYDVGAPTSISISLPGMDPLDAERRRQKALRLLSERLNQSQSEASETWPLMEESSSQSSQYDLVQTPQTHIGGTASQAPLLAPSPDQSADDSQPKVGVEQMSISTETPSTSVQTNTTTSNSLIDLGTNINDSSLK